MSKEQQDNVEQFQGLEFTVEFKEHEFLLDYSLDDQPAVHKVVLKIK